MMIILVIGAISLGCIIVEFIIAPTIKDSETDDLKKDDKINQQTN